MSFKENKQLSLDNLKEESEKWQKVFLDQGERKAQDLNFDAKQYKLSQEKMIFYESLARIVKDNYLLIYEHNIYVKVKGLYRVLASTSITPSKLDTIEMRRTLQKYTKEVKITNQFWQELVYTIVDVEEHNLFDPYNRVLFNDGILYIDFVTSQLKKEKINKNVFFTKRINLPLFESEDPTKAEIIKDYFENLSTENSDLIKEMLGEIIFPTQHLQTFYWFFGKGNNGKSKLADVLTQHFNVSGVTIDAISDSKKSFDRHALFDSSINIDAEANGVNKKSSEQIKKITGGDLMQKEKKFGAISYETITTTMLFFSNALPNFGVVNKSLKRRLKVGHFDKDFTNADPKEFRRTMEALMHKPSFSHFVLACVKMNLDSVDNGFPHGIPSNEELLNKDTGSTRFLDYFFNEVYNTHWHIGYGNNERYVIVTGTKFTYISKSWMYGIYKDWAIEKGERASNIHSEKLWAEELETFLPYVLVSKVKHGKSELQNMLKLDLTYVEKFKRDNTVEIIE